MAYSYFFTDKANQDLNNILDYLTNKLSNKEAAIRFYSALNKQIELICDFPEASTVVENKFIDFYEIRKSIIKKYIMYYYVDQSSKSIYVLTIRHSLENREKIINKGIL